MMSAHELASILRGTSLTAESASARRDLAGLAERYARSPAERWAPVLPELDWAIAGDGELAETARRARGGLMEDVALRLGAFLPHELGRRYGGAVLSVPRERFVLPEDIGHSADDAP